VPTIALVHALTLSTPVAPRADNTLIGWALATCVYRRFLFSGFIFAGRVFSVFTTLARTSCSRACACAYTSADNRDGGRNGAAHGNALGYCKRTSCGNVTDTSLYTGCYGA